MICPICISDILYAERISVLPCSHEFHHDCIANWFKISITHSCPCCRSVEVSDDVDIPIYISSLMIAAQYNDLTKIQELIDSGVNVDEVDYQGITAFSYAVVNGCIEAAKLLLSLGADIDNIDAYGNTVLITHISAGRSIMIPFLLENGANANIIDPLGDTPLEIAAFVNNGPALDLLMEHGVGRLDSAFRLASRSKSEECLYIFRSRGVSYNFFGAS